MAFDGSQEMRESVLVMGCRVGEAYRTMKSPDAWFKGQTNDRPLGKTVKGHLSALYAWCGEGGGFFTLGVQP